MSKSKSLRSLTIIPPQLYIERDADRQVTQILREMGRPGYVLVARQMGKTNLLLHAKQTLSNDSDSFLYIDVSNPIPDIRTFFRSIIDLATDTIPSGVDAVKEIEIGRQNTSRLPHKEHENELRILLRFIPGKLIICLDEIDAIAGSPYSDQVFTFIRSVYFGGRLNFDEFNRLTYLLSGVAEPADIIKNKDISPFNIGEKIYLNDFNIDEVKSLIDRAEIQLSEETLSRLYYWTNGHPRMTWDVCSYLEDQQEPVTPEDVDSTIKKLYFGEVDLPPIDHIKKLVIENKEIRDALIAIHYKKSSSILQSTQTKLYLAGITTYDVKEKILSFKNQILETALSESYLMKNAPATEKADTLTSWVERAESRNFAVALPGLLELLKITDDSINRSIITYYVGYCFFWMNNYEESLIYLKDDSETLKPDLDLMRNFYTGVASWNLFRYQSAVVFLEYLVGRVKSDHQMPWLKAEAQLYLASCLTQEEKPQADRAINLCLDSIKNIDNLIGERITLEHTELRAFAAIILAQAYKLLGNFSNAIHVLEKEIEQQDNRLKADLSVRLLQYITPSNSHSSINRAYALAMSSVINISATQLPHNDLSLDQFISLSTKLIDADRHNDAIKLAEHVFQVTPKGDTLNDVITSMCSVGLKLTRRKKDIAAKLFGLGIEAGNDVLPMEQKRQLLGLVILLGGDDSLEKYCESYIQTFENASFQEIELADFRPLYLILTDSKARIPDSLLERAYRAIRTDLPQNIEISDAELTSIRLIRDFLDIRKMLLRGDPTRAIEFVRHFRRRLDSINDFNLTWFPNDFLIQLRAMLLSLARPANLLTEKRQGKKIGRNDLVKVSYNGEIKEGKHKKFELDLASGKCEIIDIIEDKILTSSQKNNPKK